MGMKQTIFKTPAPVEGWIDKLRKENDMTITEILIAGVYRMSLLDQREIMAAVEASRTQIKLENLEKSES